MKLSNDFHSDPSMPPKGGSSPERDTRLTQAMNEYLEALEAGKAADRKSLLDRFPDLGAELITCLDGIDFIHEVAPQLGEVSLNSSHDNSAAMRPPNAALGDYRIIRELGRGGMGVVYEAEQLSMRRRVALKVLPFASVMDHRQIARFKNEAQAAGLLQHTNIVPVYGVGCERGVHYFAMQYIEGMTLAEIISELTHSPARRASIDTHSLARGASIEHAGCGPLETRGTTPPSTLPKAFLSTQRSSKPQEYFRTVARIGIQAAEALDHAHQNGILHRDVKPGNLMLDNSGNLWVTDFGLARMEGNPQMTMTEDVLGTLRYMSPEQALAKRVVVDHRSDIYSLGVTLYELLSLRPAFEGLDRGTLLRKIADEDPQPLRRVDKSIPSELETIVSKAIAKNPVDRYATALDLAEDLRRLLMHEPVRARNPSLATRLGKWIQRHRSLVYSAAAFTLAASLILASSIGWIIRDRGLRRLEAESRLVEALDMAEPLLQAGNPHQAELVSAVRKAEAQLASASGNPQLDERVFRLRSDVAMLNTLEQARLARSAVSENHFDEQSSVSAYEAAFREYGIDIPKLSQDVAANLVSQRTIALQLAVALDDWASMLLSRNLKAEANHLLNIAQLVDPDVWRNRLRGALEAGDGNRLSQLAREAQVDSLPVTTQVMLGKALVNRSMLDEAAFFLKRAQPHFPGDFWINHDLGAALMLSNQSRFDEAVGYLRTAIALRPQSPGARLNLAYALEKAGRLEETVPELQEAIRLKPDYDGAFSNLAHHLLTLDRPQEALTYFRKALELRPESSLLHCDLGECLRKADMFDEAIAAFKEAIRLSPDNSFGYNGLGLALFDKGLHEEGLSAVQQGLAIEEKRVADSPQHPGSRHMLAGMQNNVAMVLLGQGEQQQAESLLRRAIESESQLLSSAPNDRGFCEYLGNMHHNLGELLQAQGKPYEAEVEVRSSLKHRQKLAADVPSNVSYQVDLALIIAMLSSVLTDQGAAEQGDAKYAEAITLLQRLIAEFPTIPRHRFNLAIVRHARALKLQAQDRPDEVKSECQQAAVLLQELIAEFPNNNEYKKRLADCSELLLPQMKRSMSIEGWVNVKEIPLAETEDLCRGNEKGSLVSYQLTFESGGALKFTIRSLRETARVSSPIPLGQIVHVVATLDDTTGLLSLYLNGVLMSQIVTAVRPFTILDVIAEGDLGRNLLARKNVPVSGLIEKLAIFENALTEAQIISRFSKGKGSLQPTLSISDGSATEGKPSIRLLDRFVKDASGGLNNAMQLTFGPDGNGDGIQELYVTSKFNSSILRYSGATGAFLDVFVEPGAGGLSIPGDLIFDTNGNLLVSGTSSNKLHKYDSNGAFLGIVASGLNAPYGIEKRSDGSFLIANSGTDQVLKVTGSAIGSAVTTFISAGSGGLNEPRNVVVGQDGDVYVVSALTNSILKYDGSTGASKGVFAASPTGGGAMWAEFGSDGALYASFRTEAICCNVTLARFNGTTGALEDTLDSGRDSWSFIMGPNNVIYNAGNGGGNYVDRFVIAKAAAFTVSLNGPFPDTVSVTYATADSSAVAPNDYNITSDTLTFLPGEFSKRVLVSVLDDSEMEGTESFFVNLTNPVGVGATIADGQGVGTIFPPTKFYVVDDGSPDRTYEYGATGSAIENYSMQSTNTAPRGAASTAVGDKVWVVDANKKVYVYNNSGTLQGTGWSAGSLQSSSVAGLQGITTNGADVWLVEDTFSSKKNDIIYRYKDAASRISGSQNSFSSFPLNSANRNPTDLVTDGTHIWVLNNTLTTDSVFKYTVGGSFLSSWTITSGGGNPTGLTIDPTMINSHIWIVDNNTDRVYQFDSATTRTGGSASPSSSFPLAAGNTNPQGIADPPPPGDR